MNQLAKSLYALRSPDGLRVGSYVVRCDVGRIGIDVQYEGSNVVAKLDRPLKVDHANALLDRATDGLLTGFRFTVDGRAFASVEIHAPFGVVTAKEVAL